MSTPAFTLSDIMGNVLNAIYGVLGEVASALAENASVIAEVLVLGGLAFMVARYGGRIFRQLGTLLRGLLP